MSEYTHKSVLTGEVLDYLHISKGEYYVDATLGYAGHAIEIIMRGGIILGIEADPEILKLAKIRVEKACPPPDFVGGKSYKFVNENFRLIDQILKNEGIHQVSGILYDLGVSSLHYDHFDRGFSFQKASEALDMRLDQKNQNVKASDLLNVLSKKQLINMFSPFMSLGKATEISAKVIDYRSSNKFETVSDLLSITGSKSLKDKTHPATKVFLALRATVNDELEAISVSIPKSVRLLKKGGRLVVITFHSTEDSLVKSLFKNQVELGLGRILTKKSVTPTVAELIENPRARSARLRVLEKV